MDSALPVLICGAGPTGLTLALELARFGVPLRIVDRSSDPLRASFGSVLHPRTLELLEADLVTERILAFSRPLHRVALVARGKTRAVTELDRLPTAYPYLASVPQETTERALLVGLHELGTTVERGVSLTAIEQSADAVVAELASPDGRERVRCSYLAVCDGPASSVDELLGIPPTARDAEETFAVADVALDTTLPNDALTLVAGTAGGGMAIVPTPDGWRIVADTPELRHGELDSALLQRALATERLSARIEGAERLERYVVHRRKLQRYRHGRVFVLGDAAHVQSPLAAGGLNAGVGDAVNLAWKLALVVNEGVDPELLESYHHEREGAARGLFGRDPIAAHPIADELAGLRLDYARSPLSVDDRPAGPGLRAGMRVRGHRPAGPHPRIVAVRPENDDELTIVLRPDGYAGYVARGEHAGGARTYLRNVIGLHA